MKVEITIKPKVGAPFQQIFEVPVEREEDYLSQEEEETIESYCREFVNRMYSWDWVIVDE